MSNRTRWDAGDTTGTVATSPQQLVRTRELINRFWDGVSQTRLTELSFSRICGETPIGYLSAYLTPGTRCLDFGAGDGSLLKLLVERGCPTAAYEPSTLSRSQIARESLEENTLYLGTVGTEGEGSFDVIIAAEVVEHILEEEIEEVLNTFRRYLKPGGLLIVTTPNNEDLELGACYCPVSNKVFHRWQHLRSLTADSLNAMLSQGGFTRIADHRRCDRSGGEVAPANR